MYSDSEDEVFFGPLTMREIKIGFGVIEKSQSLSSKHKMESISNRNSIIEISSEENSFADLDDKENTNPIPSMKNSSITNNFENVIKESKSEDTFKNKFNECSSSSTLSINSDDTKSISSSFLDKLVECFSEGNENLYENIHVIPKKSVQLSPCLSRIDEIQSFNTNQTNNSNTSNNCNETYDLIIDLSNTSTNSENKIELNDEKEQQTVEDEIVSEVHNEYVHCISSINNDEVVSEKLGRISPMNYVEVVTKTNNVLDHNEIVSERNTEFRHNISSVNNDEVVSEKLGNCIPPINNDQFDSENLDNYILPINDVVVSENLHKCISPINNDGIVSEKPENCVSSINNDEVDLENSRNSILSLNNKEMVSEKNRNCPSPTNNDDRFSEKPQAASNELGHCRSTINNLNNIEINNIETVSSEDGFEDIDSNYSSKMGDINEIEISKILDEEDNLDGINNTFSECTLNSTNENKNIQNQEYTDEDVIHKILKKNDNFQENDQMIYATEEIRKEEHGNPTEENEINEMYTGYVDLKINNGFEEVDKIENIFFDNRPESKLDIDNIEFQDLVKENDSKEIEEHLHDISQQFNAIFDKYSENEIQNKNVDSNDSVLNESNTSYSSLGCQEINSSIGHEEPKQFPLLNRKFSTSPIGHIHPKTHHQTDTGNNCKQSNSPIGESKEVQSVNRKFFKSPIEHVHRKPHRQTDIIDNNWKQALALSNDTLIAEQSMLPTSVTLLEKTNIEQNLNSPEYNKGLFKPSMIPTILEKSEQSIDLTCSENESTLSESRDANDSSMAFEDSETECNNTLDMIDRLLKMEAATNATVVQSTEKLKQIEHVSPRKPKLIQSNVKSKIYPLSKLQTPKAIAKPLEKIKPIVKPKMNSPLKTTPKNPVVSTPTRIGLEKGNVNSKISPIVKSTLPPRKGFGLKPSSSTVKNVPTKFNVNSPKPIQSPLARNIKDFVLKPSSSASKNVPTKVNMNSPITMSPLAKNTKESLLKPSSSDIKTDSATKTSVDSPITAEVNELTESFEQGQAESSFVQLRSTLHRQLSDLYIEPSSSADKRNASKPKPKVVSNVEVKKNVFKTPTVSRVLKSTEKSKMPKNIMSPVDFYINKAPQSPLVVKCNYTKRQSKFVDCEKEKKSENNEVASIGNPLPFCAYKSASNVKLVEDNTTEVPISVRKYFPTVQYVIKHESRIKTEERKSPGLRHQTKMKNDSLNALDNSLSIFNASTNSNDVSVRVKKSALRTPK